MHAAELQGRAGGTDEEEESAVLGLRGVPDGVRQGEGRQEARREGLTGLLGRRPWAELYSPLQFWLQGANRMDGWRGEGGGPGRAE